MATESYRVPLGGRGGDEWVDVVGGTGTVV